ncbi:MAG: hypothetical protein K2Q32_00690 [Alphaproteobacteria bacterium]|nr:hypothetical protein [Alphaproteobacteria bacterium]
MKMKSALLLSTAAIVLSFPAFAAEKQTYEISTKIEKDAAGNYLEKNVTNKKDMDGTTTRAERELKINVDSKGNTEKSLTMMKSSDPKGLGNKHVESSKDTESTKDGQVNVSHEKVVNGKTIEGTHDNYKFESSAKRDEKGNFVEKDITRNVDSNGMLTETENKSSIDVDSNGDASKSTTTKVVTDPKGLNNMNTTTTTNTENTQNGQVKTSHEVTVNGKVKESVTDTAPQK